MFKKREKRQVHHDKIDTFIGHGTEFKGSLSVEGTLRIDGKIEGELDVRGDVIIGEKGFVNADIKARNLMTSGELRGNLELKGALEITDTGLVYGDIRVVNLFIAEGAVFQGHCTTQRRDPAEKPEAE